MPEERAAVLLDEARVRGLVGRAILPERASDERAVSSSLDAEGVAAGGAGGMARALAETRKLPRRLGPRRGASAERV